MKFERLTDSGYELYSVSSSAAYHKYTWHMFYFFLKFLSFSIILSFIKVAYSKLCMP
jgi:hypothetical protein